MNLPQSNSAPALVPVFAGILAGVEQHLCNARDLHGFLESRQDFSTWAKARISKYKFSEGEDFTVHRFVDSGSRGRVTTDYHLTLDTAKEFAMVERTDKGRQVRRYFIECERQLIAQRISPPSLPTASLPYVQNPGDLLSKDQADLLRNMLKEAVRRLPPDKQGPAMVQGWSKLKAHFKVTYRKIPQTEFSEAVSIIARHIADISSKQPVVALPAPQKSEEDRYYETVGRMTVSNGAMTLPLLVSAARVLSSIEGPNSGSARFVATHERLSQRP